MQTLIDIMETFHGLHYNHSGVFFQPWLWDEFMFYLWYQKYVHVLDNNFWSLTLNFHLSFLVTITTTKTNCPCIKLNKSRVALIFVAVDMCINIKNIGLDVL